MGSNQMNFEVFDEPTCISLLESGVIGRIAVCGPGGYPLIFPVSYAMNAGAITFRTSESMELLLDHSVATFEIDEIHAETQTGWSVMAHGAMQQMHEAEVPWIDQSDVVVTGARPWAPGERNRWMRVVPQLLTGRRISVPTNHADP